MTFSLSAIENIRLNEGPQFSLIPHLRTRKALAQRTLYAHRAQVSQKQTEREPSASHPQIVCIK